jgi:phage terminase large subunit-like protein
VNGGKFGRRMIPLIVILPLMSWDTAFEKSNRADYSACTLWGVFYQDDATGKSQANIILLNAFRDRMEFPELKQRAIEQYDEWEPDSVIIEKKASGAPLIYEMRAMGIPVTRVYTEPR